jgi:DNA invertase Pin-like site-specific DNA recombinase
VVIFEALDRLARKLSDVASLHDELKFHGMVLHAVNVGAVTTMHVGKNDRTICRQKIKARILKALK